MKGQREPSGLVMEKQASGSGKAHRLASAARSGTEMLLTGISLVIVGCLAAPAAVLLLLSFAGWFVVQKAAAWFG